MKILTISMLALTLTSCTARGHHDAEIRQMTVAGDSLPQIRHMTEMKITGDTLWLTYETEGGFGQRFLRYAIIDIANATLRISPDLGLRPDGYYTSYMPYPAGRVDGDMLVVGQDDAMIYKAPNDTDLIPTADCILSTDFALPFPLSMHAQDVSVIGPDEYIFIGREPKGGPQYAMKSNIAVSRVDTIRSLRISPDLAPWMPNAGELAYSATRRRLASAYRLHPAIDIFSIDGKTTRQARLGPDTFVPSTLTEADFEDLNPLHFVDISATPDCIYALHWGFKASESAKSSPTIFKIGWDGQILSSIRLLPARLAKIAASDSIIIGWRPDAFCLIRP